MDFINKHQKFLSKHLNKMLDASVEGDHKTVQTSSRSIRKSYIEYLLDNPSLDNKTEKKLRSELKNIKVI